MGTLRVLRASASATSCLILLSAAASPQATERVSVDSAGAEGNQSSILPALSTSGRFVAFISTASNLVTGDTNGFIDVFVHDDVTGVTERVSVDSSGAQGNNHSGWESTVSISADGLIVAFGSKASNLVANDNNGHMDVFVHDRSTGITDRISVSSSGKQGNDDSNYPYVSSDGRFVAFTSWATNLVAGDTNGAQDAFIHDRSTGTTERFSVDSSGAEANGASYAEGISADGGVVSFLSFATNLVGADNNGFADVFVRDRSTGITERVNVSSSGAEADSYNSGGALSADGELVAFDSAADDLVAHDTNGAWDIFVHDRSAGTTERVSVDSSGNQGNYDSINSTISADGTIVEFTSYASDLVPFDTNGFNDIFTHDRSSGQTRRISVSTSGKQGNDNSGDGAISGGGYVVTFWSNATNLVNGDKNGFADVFVSGCLADASWTNYGFGFPGTNGVPAFTSRQNPVFGTTITLDLGNSYGLPTAGVILVGFQRTFVPTNLGGDLLVTPALVLPVNFSYGFDSFTGSIPDDESLCGAVVDLQALEVDPGAAKGVSFTQGLELVIGS